MVDRISTLTGHNKTLRNISMVQTDLAKVTQQISSGKKANTFSEINGLVERFSANNSKLNRIDSYISNNKAVNTRLQIMDKSVDEVQKALEEFASTLTLRTGATNSEQMNFQSVVNEQLQRVKDALNVTVEGRYIFSGTKTDIKPVKDYITVTENAVPDSTYYQGNSEVLSARISDNRNIDYGVKADELGFQSAIAALVSAKNLDAQQNSPDFSEVRDLLNDAIEQVANIRAGINADITTIETTNADHETMKIYWKQAVSDDVDTDIAEASIRLTSDQTILQATYQTFALVSQLKLSDFL